MYKTIQKLGDGVFGSVTKAIDERTHEFVAIKSYRDNSMRDEEKIKEIQILKKLNHPNIIKLRDVIR
jgi:protein kinase